MAPSQNFCLKTNVDICHMRYSVRI